MHNLSEWRSCTILKMQFVDLLLVRWIFWEKFGHKNYEDFEHPTFSGLSEKLSAISRQFLKRYSPEESIAMFTPVRDNK